MSRKVRHSSATSAHRIRERETQRALRNIRNHSVSDITINFDEFEDFEDFEEMNTSGGKHFDHRSDWD